MQQPGICRIPLPPLGSSPRASARIMFGGQEAVEKRAHSVVVHIPVGEEMAFPLPGSSLLWVLKPLQVIEGIGRQRVVCESWANRDGKDEVLSNFVIGEGEHTAYVIHDKLSPLSWLAALGFEGLVSGAQGPAYAFKIDSAGFQLWSDALK